MYQEFGLSASILTETWFWSGEKSREEMDDLEHGENIGLITRNRSGRGGGVAVAFNINALNLKEFKLPGNTYEMVCAVGSSAASNRKIAIISIYIPPKQRVETTVEFQILGIWIELF